MSPCVVCLSVNYNYDVSLAPPRFINMCLGSTSTDALPVPLRHIRLLPFRSSLKYIILQLQNQKAYSKHTRFTDYGDRMQELVVIGVHLDKQKIVDELNACLLNDEE